MENVYSNHEICHTERVSEILRENYRNFWINELPLKSKLDMYRIVKSNYKTENYVTDNIDSHLRSFIAQIRCGILPLHIETGRYIGTDRNKRVCKICNCNIVEDEIHFIFVCPKYATSRKLFFDKITKYCPDFESYNTNDQLKKAFQYPLYIGKFIKEAFYIRQSIIYQ